MDKAKALLPNVTYVDDMNAVADGCDALVVATNGTSSSSSISPAPKKA